MPSRGGCEVEGEEPTNFALGREGQDVGCSAPLSSRMSSATSALAWPLPAGPRARSEARVAMKPHEALSVRDSPAADAIASQHQRHIVVFTH
jgi:hypothetical protein